jgi:hypothetical protein
LTPSFFEPDRYMEVFQRDRCPLCFLVHDYSQSYIRNLLEESVTDSLTRKQLLDSHGFCRRHAWQAVNTGQSLGMAVFYSHLLRKGLQEVAAPSVFRKKKSICPVCAAENSIEDAQAKQFTACWTQSEPLRRAFQDRGVLCLSHLEKISSQMKPASQRRSLLESAQKALEPLLKDLNEFLEKQDYHRSKEAMGEEWDSWIRAVRMVSGERE